MKKYIVLIGLLVFCMSCATVNITYDFDQEANFAGIKTYDWLPVPEKAYDNELIIKRIKHAVNRDLQAKGLQMTKDNPDIVIAIRGGKEKKVDVQEWGYGYDDRTHYDYNWGPHHPWEYRDPIGRDRFEYRRGVDTYEYELGTLILDFVDAKKKELIWRGTATGVVDTSKTAEQINEVVGKILENYPPSRKK